MAQNANSSWEKIQQNIKDVERLMGQKEYNSSMIKARQTLEFMVKLQAERACITETEDLKGLIENLYQNRWISKTTYEHYTTIRIIGNKAVHEDYANAYDANQAFHLLSQEVYTFANNYKNARRGTKPSANRTSKTHSSKSRTSQTGTSASRNSSGNRSASSAGSRSRKQTQKKQATFTIYDLLKLAIPVLCILLLFIVIKLVKPSNDSTITTAAPTTTAATVTPTPVPTTAATPETSEKAPVYKTTSNLNVRPAPNTEQERIGRLDAGTIVEYVREYDENWAVILYEGQEAYVSSQYLTME